MEQGGCTKKESAEVDVSYEALLEELKKHGPEVRRELYIHLFEARSRKNSALSSGEDDSHKSFKEPPD